MFQDRYIAYAVEHDKTPEAMLEFDRQRYPGGVMGGFLTWHPKDVQWLRKDQSPLPDELPDAGPHFVQAGEPCDIANIGI